MNDPLLSSQIDELFKHISMSLGQLRTAPPPYNELLTEAFTQVNTALAELRQLNESLVEAGMRVELERVRYQRLFDFAPVGYVVTDEEGTIREANQAACVLLNTPSQSLLQ